MAVGETIGFSTRLTQNNLTTYLGSRAERECNRHSVHIALMGDPTLRMHPVIPPSAPTATRSGRSVGIVCQVAALTP